MSRHTARIHVLNLVFQFPFHPEWAGSKGLFMEAGEQYLSALPDYQGLLAGLSPDDGERLFIEETAAGVFDKQMQIDTMINERLKNWSFERIAKIDIALLRLAAYEMCFSSDVTVATAINEAVELAKIYGTDDSPAFINGVLGHLAKAGINSAEETAADG